MSKYANFQDVQANYKAFCHGHENIWLKNWKWVTLPHISRSFVECKVIFWVLWNKKAANTYQTKKHLWHCFLYDCLLIFRHLFSKNAKVRGKLAEKSQKMGAWQLLGQHLLGRVNVLGRHKNMIYNSFSTLILFISFVIFNVLEYFSEDNKRLKSPFGYGVILGSIFFVLSSFCLRNKIQSDTQPWCTLQSDDWLLGFQMRHADLWINPCRKYTMRFQRYLNTFIWNKLEKMVSSVSSLLLVVLLFQTSSGYFWWFLRCYQCYEQQQCSEQVLSYLLVWPVLDEEKVHVEAKLMIATTSLESVWLIQKDSPNC